MKTVIITGANGNLGSAVTEKFLVSGYRVIATVSHSDAIYSVPGHPLLDVYAVNLTDENETLKFIEEVTEKYKTVDAGILLVGGFASGGIDNTSGTDLRKQYSLNFETTYFVCRPLFNFMLQQNNGRLIFVGARPALKAEDGKSFLAYSLSKSLVFKLADLLNEAAKGTNVSTSVVVPGTIDTPINRKNNPTSNFDDWVKPQQIADVMEMICSGTGAPLRESVLKIYGNS